MPKKKSKKAPKAKRNARDIQTPFSDRENSERAEPKQITDHRAESSHNKKGKKVDITRSPTREGDFASNASGYDSGDATDPELYDASDQDGPSEEQPDPLSSWVKDIIRSQTLEQSEKMVESFFTTDNPDYAACEAFFDRLNQLIRGANEQHNVTDIDVGIIPATGYNGLCQAWQEAGKKAIADQSPENFWSAFNETRDVLKIFNKRYHLPRAWNISKEWAEKRIGTPNPRAETESGSSDDGQSILAGQPATSNEDIDMNSTDMNSDDNGGTGLDALEARTMKQQRRLTSAKVLYWWPKGTGSQTFVQYGDSTTPIYRIRAGSHESYSPHMVERVLTTKTRGNAKGTRTRNGIPEEFWKYKREHVANILGVGWKIEDDDEEGLNPLDLLQPAKGAYYPQTRTLVEWTDGVITLEGRPFIRRITTGSTLDGDRVIYQKAKELETAYRKKAGLESFVDDDYDEDSDASFGRGRRYRSEPTRYSKQVNMKARNRFRHGTSESSGSESEDVARPRNSGYTRHRSESDYRPSRLRGRKGSEREQDRAMIRKLEKEIERLKIGSSISGEDRRRPQGKR
ncbi:hypothetical protein ASPZODRAFT_147845 [Penicilliopsis zonata CBS 506.65]|uniref:Uncharacterized protein n=1 Tax=Penicilliopsis zonata CBS 506.65 TaxID=1073090 RepID=A0A1L9S4D5_9EURO|nr:hypothetical protein ASPZODRAFT_147845 [Penicilliopsis zonata CBS 506.65]OJJ42037.1 hypothetical protein ASPZODRAFT_147845 [Penicilliopsis zonata CBS 506.65]